MLDLQPTLRAVQTMHPKARGCIVIVHDDAGHFHVNCASFTPATSAEAHHEEMQQLVASAPKVAKLWHDSVVAESRARQQEPA